MDNKPLYVVIKQRQQNVEDFSSQEGLCIFNDCCDICYILGMDFIFRYWYYCYWSMFFLISHGKFMMISGEVIVFL